MTYSPPEFHNPQDPNVPRSTSNSSEEQKARRERNDNHPLCRLGLDTHQAEVHSTSMKLLEVCPRKFMYIERFHLQRKGTNHSALNVGKFFHKYMEGLLQGRSLEAAALMAAHELAKLRTAWETEADEMGILPSGESVQSLLTSAEHDLQKAGVMAIYVHEKFPFPTNYSVVDIEKSVRFKAVERPAPCRVRFDAIVEDQTTGDLWVVDHKTTSASPAAVAATYQYAVQPRLYLLGARALYAPRRVVGVCHNVILKPTIKWKKKQTWNEYLQEIREWYAARPADDPPFIRSWVRFPETPDAELTTRIKRACAACKTWPSLDRFYRNEDSCFQWNHLCSYFPLCSTDPAIWDSVIDNLFKVAYRDDDDLDYTDLI